MNLHRTIPLFLIPVLLALASCEQGENGSGAAANQGVSSEREGEVRHTVREYMNAINRRDINAVSEFWDAKAVYKNPVTGELIQGREGIKAQFSKLFEQLRNADVELKVKSVEFPLKDKAIEEGVFIIKREGKVALESPYRISLVDEHGKWYIQHVSELDLSRLE